MALQRPATETTLPYDPLDTPWLAALASGWWRRRWRGASAVARICARLLRSRDCRLRIAGDELTIPFADPISFLYLAGGVLNARCVAALDPIVQPGSVVFDVGANYGLFGWQALRRVGPQGKVVFFEPNPQVAQRLRRNLEANGVRNALLVEKAVSRCEGTATLLVPPGGQSGLATVEGDATDVRGWRPQTIESVSLDSFVQTTGLQPALIKLDVEGHELSVLQGAEETLRTGHPVLMLETEFPAWEPGSQTAEAILALLARHGYDHLYAASHTTLRQLTTVAGPMNDLIAAIRPLPLAECTSEG